MSFFKIAAIAIVSLSIVFPAAAQNKETLLAPLMYPSKNLNEADADLVIIALSTKVPISLTKNIAGEDVLIARQASKQTREAKLCVIADGGSYPALSLEQLHETLSATITPWLSKAMSSTKLTLGLGTCLDNDENFERDIWKYPEIMVIQRRFLPALRDASVYQGKEKLFIQVGVIGKEFFFESRRDLASKKQKAEESRQEQLKTLAEAAKRSDTSQLGSLVLQPPKDKINLCSVNNVEDDKPFYLGYSFNYAKYTPKGWLTELKNNNPKLKPEQTKNYSKSFKTVDDFYVQFSAGSSGCHIFVGPPAEIESIRVALKRDKGESFDLIGAFVAKSVLADDWAKAVGYQNFPQYVLSQRVKTNADTVKALQQYGIDSELKYVEAQEQMRAIRYADSNEAQEVLAYLRDKQVGDKEGKPPAIVRTERQKRERAEAEQRAVEQKKARLEYAKKFPYTALISCSLSESALVTLNACFFNKYSQTELEITNGREYRMYTPSDLLSAGQLTEEGLEIPLQMAFSITAQNAGESVLLNVKILDNKSGQITFKKSVAQYGVIKVTN